MHDHRGDQRIPLTAATGYRLAVHRCRCCAVRAVWRGGDGGRQCGDWREFSTSKALVAWMDSLVGGSPDAAR